MCSRLEGTSSRFAEIQKMSMQLLSPPDDGPDAAFAASSNVYADQAVAGGAERVPELAAGYAGLDGISLLRPLIEREFFGRLPTGSSFGGESAGILAMAPQADPSTPHPFLGTRKMCSGTPPH